MALDFDTNLIADEDRDFFASCVATFSPAQDPQLASVYVTLREVRESQLAAERITDHDDANVAQTRSNVARSQRAGRGIRG